MASANRRREAVVIIGAGGHGKVVCDALVTAGRHVVGWIDDNPRLRGVIFCGHPVLGCRKDLGYILGRFRQFQLQFVVAVGDNARRGQIFNEIILHGYIPTNAIHPQAIVAPSVCLGRGVVICAGAIINPDTVIGDNVIINTAASIDHDNTIERDVHLSPGSHTGGHVCIGQGSHIGLGAVILPNLCVGAYSTVGAGAVVNRNLPARVVAVGVPVRIERTAS